MYVCNWSNRRAHMNALAQTKLKTNKQMSNTTQHADTMRATTVAERRGRDQKKKHIMFLSIQLYQMQNNREIAHKIVTSRNKTCIETCSQDSEVKKRVWFKLHTSKQYSTAEKNVASPNEYAMLFYNYCISLSACNSQTKKKEKKEEWNNAWCSTTKYVLKWTHTFIRMQAHKW